MFQKRSLPAFFLMASLGAAVTAAVFAPTPAAAGDDFCDKLTYAKAIPSCKAAKKKVTNEATAKHWMKDLRKAAKDRGKDIDCGDCHEDKLKGGKLIIKGAELDKKWAEFAG